MSDSTLPLAPDRYTGRRMGKYEVLCRLSSGGMSEIFLAFQRGLAGFRKLVVLKQILPDIQEEQDVVRMFLNEAKITAAFNHPNIAHVYDLDVSNGELFLAMEFIPGATLIEVARECREANEPIPLGFTLAAVRDTALALHYAHTFKDPVGRPRQVIHRDVAEKNIMVTYEGTTKLLDFGIAKMVGREPETAVGRVKGTSGYMSPEQIRGDELDLRTDIFSLGIVLHECLTGIRLFYGRDAEEGMKAALESRPEPPSRHNKAVGPDLDAVTLRALAYLRENRYATALEFARALERASAGRIWLPEQCGELMQRFFADRREQTEKLLMGATLQEVSGEIPLPKRRPSSEPPAASVKEDRSVRVDPKEDRSVRVDPMVVLPALKKIGPTPALGVLPPPHQVLTDPAIAPLEPGAGQAPENDEQTVVTPEPRSRPTNTSRPALKSRPIARNILPETDPSRPPPPARHMSRARRESPAQPVQAGRTRRRRLLLAVGLAVALLGGLVILLRLLGRL